MLLVVLYLAGIVAATAAIGHANMRATREAGRSADERRFRPLSENGERGIEGWPAREVKPSPSNVPGDFYVEDGCCTSCGVTWHYAADLFGAPEDPDDYAGCYVKKQPQSEAELENMFEVIGAAELQCIRYRGRDPKILGRLRAMGETEVCDFTANGYENS